MCEVTKSNFEQKYAEIESICKNAVFIALDCEFSGLEAQEKLKRSVFDSSEVRYTKVKTNIEQFIPIQIGICPFHFNRNKNEYIGYPYTFYICPEVVGQWDRKFLFQSSALHFLSDHKFDFNKFIYEGITYLNRFQESVLVEKISSNQLEQYLHKYVHFEYSDLLKKIYNRVLDWFPTAKDDDEIELSNHFKLSSSKSDFIYLLHKHVRSVSPFKIWSFEENAVIKVKKVNEDVYRKLEEATTTLEEDFLNSSLGFTKVYHLLMKLKKPLVGHNLFQDLLITYAHFYEDLPTRYNTLKKNINNLFPCIYDTKYMSFQAKNLISRDLLWQSNSLDNLYRYFKDEKGRHIVFNSPLIQRAPEFVLNMNSFHEAGWDSYCTGYCFIRMAHIFACKKSRTSGIEMCSTQHMKAVEQFKNCINVIRGNINFMRLDNVDPVSQRPQWLYIQSCRGNSLEVQKILELFGKYGCVHMKQESKTSAIIAVQQHTTARLLLSKFEKHNEFHVTYYNFLKHSPGIKVCLWSGGILISGGFLSWFIYKKLL